MELLTREELEARRHRLLGELMVVRSMRPTEEIEEDLRDIEFLLGVGDGTQ